MKRKTKILIKAIIFCLITIMFSTINYATTGSMFLGLKGKDISRDTGTYTFNNKAIFKIVKFNEQGTTEIGDNTAIYCLKAGPGFGSEDYETNVIEYTNYFNLVNPNGIESPYREQLPEDMNTYNKLMWILENLYVPAKTNATPEEIKLAEESKKALLDNAGISLSSFLRDEETYGAEIEDILECIQQMAIWYYTNPDGDYHNPYTDRLELQVDGESVAEKYNLGLVDTDIDLIYRYLVQGAENAVNSGYTYETEATSPLTLESSTATAVIEGNNYIVGPYTINEIREEEYVLTGRITDGTNDINNVKILDQDKQEISTGEDISDKLNETIGNEFYISVPMSENVSKVAIELNVDVNTINASMWTTSANSLNINQPVVVLEHSKGNYKLNHNLEMPEPEGAYNFKLVKQDANGINKLENAKFSISINGVKYQEEYTTNENGEININDIEITQTSTPDTIEIQEIEAPSGYILNNEIITLTVNKILQNGKYIASSVTGSDNANLQTDPSGVNTVNLVVNNTPMSGAYNLKIVKQDDDGTKLQNAKFNVRINNGASQEYTTNENGEITINGIQITDVNTADTIEIQETEAPDGYILNNEVITLTVTKGESGNSYVATGVTGSPNANLQGNTVNLIVNNTPISGAYNFKLVKQDDDGTKLQNAKFSISINEEKLQEEYSSNENGEIEINNIPITNIDTPDTIEIQEIEAPEGYILNNEVITLTVTKGESGNSYVATGVTGSENANLEGNTVNIVINNTKLEGSYNIKLIKYDEANPDKKLENAKFEVTIGNEVEEHTTDTNGIISIGKGITGANEEINIKIEEIETPEGYDKILENPIELKLETGVSNGKYIISNWENISQNAEITFEEETNTITINVANRKQNFDLALRKFITQINGEGVESREPQITDEEKENLTNGEATFDEGTTAQKNHTKTPLAVETGYRVIYTIRIYNEGKIDGYAKEITDYLPEGLDLVPTSESSINQRYGWVQEGRVVKTRYLENTLINGVENNEISYVDVQIECEVSKNATGEDQNLKNVAEITEAEDITGSTEDIDSTPENLTEEEKNNYNPGTSEQGKGYEDDDDYEELIIPGKYFDLSLRKFITGINDREITNREPVVDTSPLLSGQTTANYNHTKTPLEVKKGDEVIYTIRVYNEGQVDGYVEKIVDHLPPELEFLPEDELNVRYGWTQTDERTIETNYLENTLLTAFNGENELAYADIQIKCRVRDDASYLKEITNIAEITEYRNDLNIPDRDNENEVQLPSDEDLPNYRDEEIERGDEYIPGQEDDDDFEKVVLEKFDLALRKFITGVNDEEITNRVPQVDTTPIKTEEGTTAKYEHTKDPVRVCQNDTVIYTIRIYNEGTMSGYAEEIKDDVPEGLVFLPEHEINMQYRWVMYDANGNETENAEETVYIRSDYLSKANETTPRENLLQAYNPETMEKPDYRDVQVAFRVSEPNTSDRIIINRAEISDDADENGDEVEDIDSTPDEWNEGEDDQDIEKIYVQYFDLSLRKWVSQAIVIEDGVEKVKDTGHYAEQDPEPVVRVDLNQDRIDNTIIKFRYQIRITNEGEIPGYATEISDYIPEGLEFNQADNPLWREIDGKIVTDQLKDTLLNPGDSSSVEVVLTWINDEENMGVMINTAEISEDYNESGTPDIDSTPNNKQEGEDDIDDAPVALTMVTGRAPLYIGITAGTMAIIAGGVFLIKKYVI